MPSTTLQHAPLPATTTSTPDRNLTLRILPAVAFTFVTYLCIGISLATLPTFVHRDLGLSAILAGLFISLQYIATFASRSYAGRMADTLGPRHTVRRALLFTALSGLFLALAGLFQHSLWIAIAALTLSRLTLGVGESLGAVGAIMWGIGRVGAPNTARVIAWNGVATFTPIALGAPLGILLVARGGIAALGLFVIAVCLAAYVVATRMASTATPEGERIPLRHILPRVTPYGLALALGGMGFGVIATFITLYFAHRNWQGAALSLTIYGLAFVLARLLFASFIDRFGGFPIAAISLAIETLGLTLLALDHSRQLAYIGCGLTGLGFSLVFPALGVEVANTFPPASRGSVLALYSAFVDLALFLTGPIAGLVISLRGYPATFLGIAATVLAALLLTLWLARSVQAKPAEI